MGDGYGTCQLHRWCDGPFLSHYNKEPLWWGRTQIRTKRLVESQLWDESEKEHFLSLGLPKDLEEEVCSMFQSHMEERGRPADLAERIKMAYQGELEIDDSVAPLPPVDVNEYENLRVKFRYFSRASGSNTATLIFDCGKESTRKKYAYITKEHPSITDCDYDVLSFLAALQIAKGPHVAFRFGRLDGTTFQRIIPDPETQSADQIRKLFPPGQLFNDEQIVALCGLNTLKSQGILDVTYFENPPKSLTSDPSFKDACEKFSVSSDYFNIHLHDAVLKMTELGVPERNWCQRYPEPTFGNDTLHNQDAFLGANQDGGIYWGHHINPKDAGSWFSKT